MADRVDSFTYSGLRHLFTTFADLGFETRDYWDAHEAPHSIILRHDCDLSLTKALKLAEIEFQDHVHATFFVLLRSPFYNVFSLNSIVTLSKIRQFGHEIGLHFDETAYVDRSNESLVSAIKIEADILSQIIQAPIRTVSMHRPSSSILAANLQIPEIENTYSRPYFSDIKYLSDSRMNWREDPAAFLRSRPTPRCIQILIHPIWYSNVERTITQALLDFLREVGDERYDDLKDNIRDLSTILSKEQLNEHFSQ